MMLQWEGEDARAARRAAAERAELLEHTVGDATTREANEQAAAVATEPSGGLDLLVSCVGVFNYRRIEDPICRP